MPGRKILSSLTRQARETYDSVTNSLSSFSYQPIAHTGIPIATASTFFNEKIRQQGSRTRQIAAIVATALVLYVVARVFFLPTDPFVAARLALTKEQYIDAVIREPIEGLIDFEPIQRKCKSVELQPGLIWHCSMLRGGLGNVGNAWLNCMLFGIEAGASIIIIPELSTRDDNDLINMHLGTGEVSIMYDVEYFTTAWAEACPQIQVAASPKDVANLPAEADAYALQPFAVRGVERVRRMVIDPIGWRRAFDGWLDLYVNTTGMSLDNPAHVYCNSSLFAWDRAAIPRDFAYSFARLFRFQPNLLRLGAAALWGLEQRLGQPVVADAILFPELTAKYSTTPSLTHKWGTFRANNINDEPQSNTSLVTSLGRDRIVSHSFMAAHLRVDSDSEKVHWPGYEYQVPIYLEEAAARNFSNIYVAAGSADSLRRFVADAAQNNITVYTKDDVLDEDELATLHGLAWDQRAIIDAQVLLYASYFTGFARSTFSLAAAIRRTSLPESGPVIINTKRGIDDAGLSRRAEQPTYEVYRDSLSRIIGGIRDQRVDSIWP